MNDPSTAISCIDQLSRILIRWVGRFPPESHLYKPPHVLRVVLPWIDLDGMLDTGVDADTARATRRRFLETFADSPVMVIPAHFPTPTAGWIRSHDGSFRFHFDRLR